MTTPTHNSGRVDSITPSTRRPPKPPKKRTYSTPRASQHCHICSRRPKEGSPHQVCGNVAQGQCRKSICMACFQKYGWDLEAARERTEGTWKCPHCRGECPQRAQCVIYNRTSQRRRLKLANDRKRKLQNGIAPQPKKRHVSVGNDGVVGGPLETPQIHSADGSVKGQDVTPLVKRDDGETRRSRVHEKESIARTARAHASSSKEVNVAGHRDAEIEQEEPQHVTRMVIERYTTQNGRVAPRVKHEAFSGMNGGELLFMEEVEGCEIGRMGLYLDDFLPDPLQKEERNTGINEFAEKMLAFEDRGRSLAGFLNSLDAARQS